MSEEPQTPTTPEEPKTPTQNTEDGDKPKETSFLDRADERAKRDEALYEKLKGERIKLEDIYARMRLGGMSEAGQTIVKKEETKEDIAKKFEDGQLDILA